MLKTQEINKHNLKHKQKKKHIKMSIFLYTLLFIMTEENI